ncbi:MAG: hypothetical protein FWC20_12425 [Oscillospiraceae bacterium]|nr:hypothetical protein [Oscillospiraceae bacterium]MCL2280191.1 hypothetical protein [Oscillospiraceae bacterium]
MKKLGIGCLVAVGIVIVIITIIITSILIFGHLLPDTPPFLASVREARMEEYFLRDKELFVVVRNYLSALRIEYDSDSILIRSRDVRGQFDGTVNLGREHGRVFIEDEAVLNAIHRLFRKGYPVIYIDDESVQFMRWRTLDDGWGALYVFDGNASYAGTLGDEHFPIELLSSLPAEGWYFYISR